MSYIQKVGLKDVRAAALAALKAGRIQHEARGNVDEKNALLTGAVTIEQVVKLLNACRGDQYESSRHHLIDGVEVHIFKPEASIVAGTVRTRWYVKLYMLDPDVWFISVHESKGGRKS